MPTVYRILLSKGYFPKELPPNFFSEHFAIYASSRVGRMCLKKYKPADNFTRCTDYELALAGGGRRPLALPHPWSYAELAGIVARSFRRLLKKSGRSRCSRSRPVYEDGGHRALRTSIRASSLARERVAVRAGARYLLKADVSQFYPSLYTHAIGWAIDPKLREKKHWQNHGLLGKRLDQAMMNLQGKVSQGIPVGPDISFLLAEAVLAQVDSELGLTHDRSIRWFDDYEIACDSMEDAERRLGELHRVLGTFGLRLNPTKTKILPLPDPSLEVWHARLSDASRNLGERTTATQLAGFFDEAFRLRAAHPDAAVLSYALAMLFRMRAPAGHVARVGQSCISQAVLAEPGCAQKAFAVLTYWTLNGFQIDAALFGATVSQVIVQQRHRGFSSDVSWGLAFANQFKLPLTKKAVTALAACEDDCISLQALHLRRNGLLPKSFTSRALTVATQAGDLDGPNWLLLYEAHRQGYSTATRSLVPTHALFGDLLTRGVAFYRDVPAYNALLHPGGAPEWLVKRWLDDLQKPGGKKDGEKRPAKWTKGPGALTGIGQDVRRLGAPAEKLNTQALIALLLDIEDKQKPTVDEEDTGDVY